MRTRNSLINIIVSCGSYVLIMISSFLTRGVFSRQLGLAVVGIDGLFTNITSMLAIAELGIGVGIVYKLYKPIADGDKTRIAILLNFYKKAYGYIASVLFILGLGMSCFVWIFAKDTNYSKLQLGIFFMFYIFDTLCSYLFAHKRAMFSADQKNYVNNIAHTICQVLSCILQVSTLLLFENYIIYLVLKVGLRLLESVIISLQYNRKYSDIDLKIKDQMPELERKDLFSNIKAMFLHRVAGVSVQSTSSMIISYGVNIVSAGIYSNYTLITNGLVNVTSQLFNGIVASFGNLLVTTDKEHSFQNFKIIYFINYLIYSFFAIGMLVVSAPFVRIWIGDKGVFPLGTTLLIVIYFYMTGMRQSVYMVRTSAGIYQPDKWLAVLEAVLNIGLSILLVKPFGVNGILCANLISLLAVPFWTQPWIVYKMVFGKGLWFHFRRYFFYGIILVISATITYAACAVLPIENIYLRLVVNVALAVIIPNGINILLFHKTYEFQYLKNLALNLLRALKNRNKAEELEKQNQK